MPEPKEQAVREQLHRVLTSPGFLHSERLRRFLTHCVEATLAGRVEDLKEYTIGVAAFDRPTHYNPAEDPIVRVEARRLRKKLDEYYQSTGASDPIIIQLPKGGYLPVFEQRREEPLPPPPPPPPVLPPIPTPTPTTARGSVLRLGIGAAVVLGIAGGFWALSMRPLPPRNFSLTRLTSHRGLTTDPALSPDGSLLVYASDRAGVGGLNIWIQPVNPAGTGGEASQLTTDAADDSQPAISPDRSMVAFRSERQPAGVYVVPATGGPAKLLAPDGRNPRYSPDGKWIAYWVGAPGGDSLPPAGKVYVIPAAGGTPRHLLANFSSAACPVWSSDSQTLLVEASPSLADRMDLWTVRLNNERATATGVAQTMEEAHLKFLLRDCGVAWGKRAFTLAAQDGDTQNLWSLPVGDDGRVAGALARLTFGAAEESLPSEATSGDIAFAARNETSEIWRSPADHPDQLERVTEGVATATFPSVAGHHLTYLATAGGRATVWFKDLATGETKAVTKPGSEPKYPQLCPDGQTVVYSDGPNAYAADVRSQAEPRMLCNGCARVWQCNEHELFSVPAGAASPVGVEAFGLPAGPKRLLTAGGYDLANSQRSGDGWLAFHAITGPAQRRIFVAPYRAEKAIDPSEWIPVTDGLHLDRNAVWNREGDRLFFLSERCGFRCIWSQRLDPVTKRPVGQPEAVRHFHSARRGLSAIGDSGAIGLTFSDGYLYFALAEQTGDLWLARNRAISTVTYPLPVRKP